MPVYNIQRAGKTYRVESASPEQASASLDQMLGASSVAADGGRGAPLGRSQRLLAAGATRAVTGLGQLGAAGLEALGAEGAVEGTTEAIKRFEGAIAGRRPEDLSAGEQTAMDVAGMGASVALPMGALGRLPQGVAALGKGIAKGAGLGAASAAATFDPGATEAWDKVTQGMFGAASGAVVGAALNALPALKNVVIRIFRRPPTPENAKVLADIAKSPEFQRELEHLTIAEKSGRYEQKIQESRVKGTRAQDEKNEALNRARELVANKFTKSNLSSSQIGGKIQEAINAERKTAQTAAGRDYEQTVTLAKTVARSDVAYDAGLKVPNVVNAVSESFPMGSAWYDNLMDPALKKYGKQIDETAQMLVKNNGKVGLDDLISLHQAATRLRAGIAQLERGKKVSDETYSAMRLGKKLVGAIDQDVRAMDATLAEAAARPGFGATFPGGTAPGAKFQEAWGLFKRARNDYSKFIDEMRDLDRSAVNQAFGMDAKDPAEAIRKILKAEPKEQETLVRVLRDNGGGETLTELKRWKVEDAVNRMMDLSTGGTVTPVDPTKFINEFTDGTRLDGDLLFTRAEKEHLKAGLGYMRLILNEASQSARPVEVKRGVMAAVSAAPAFVAGSLYDLLANQKLEELFFTPKGRKILTTLAHSKPNTSAYEIAAGQLAGMASSAE